MKTRTKIGAFKWTLSKECVPQVGSLIETHLGIGVVIQREVIHYETSYNEWLLRAISEVGKERALSLYDEKNRDPFFSDERGALALKLTSNIGEVWVLMPHTHYNREGPIMVRTWWCDYYYPTFTERDPEFDYDAFNKEVA